MKAANAGHVADRRCDHTRSDDFRPPLFDGRVTVRLMYDLNTRTDLLHVHIEPRGGAQRTVDVEMASEQYAVALEAVRGIVDGGLGSLMGSQPGRVCVTAAGYKS